MSTQIKEKDNRAEQSARAALESIVAEVSRLQHCDDCDGTDCELDRETILGGVNVWHDQKISKKQLAEYRKQYHDSEEARQSIQEGPLSVEVRGGWHTPGSQDDSGAYEYVILLGTGGPAVRIYGAIGQHNEPDNAELQYQDWFTPWEPLFIENADDRDALLTYAQQFYFSD